MHHRRNSDPARVPQRSCAFAAPDRRSIPEHQNCLMIERTRCLRAALLVQACGGQTHPKRPANAPSPTKPSTRARTTVRHRRHGTGTGTYPSTSAIRERTGTQPSTIHQPAVQSVPARTAAAAAAGPGGRSVWVLVTLTAECRRTLSGSWAPVIVNQVLETLGRIWAPTVRDVDQLMTAVSAEVSHSQPVASGRPAGRPDSVVSVVAHFGMARSAEARALA